MQPRLIDTWVQPPLMAKDFVKQLRWLKLQLPNNIETLIESIMPLEVNSEYRVRIITYENDSASTRPRELRLLS